ncbi:MAG: Uma2 family endonuclease [Cyanobacteriota bacterium]|nr:Uma2 family endonuclease [Cyanobacteriota bacterium]
MTQTIAPIATPQTNYPLVLHDISWDTYEQLLEIFADKPALHLTYYHGTLELALSQPEQERYGWILARLTIILSEELGLEIRGLKSTTWRSKPKAVGKEADECFYIQNEAKVRGKLSIELSIDPPPDLAIEIDTTHSSIDKMAIYAGLQVPEIWRWKNGKLTIYLLSEEQYRESETSLAFGEFPVSELARFMQLDTDKGENARMREFRQWVRSQISTTQDKSR